MTEPENMRPILENRIQPAVGTVCFKDNHVLLIRRGKPPLIGEWSLPGGRIELGERTEAAALRELKEETGVSACIIGLVDVVDGIFKSRRSGETTRHYLLFDFAAIWEAGEPVAGDDAADAKWITLDTLHEVELWDETRRIILDAWRLVESA